MPIENAEQARDLAGKVRDEQGFETRLKWVLMEIEKAAQKGDYWIWFPTYWGHDTERRTVPNPSPTVRRQLVVELDRLGFKNEEHTVWDADDKHDFTHARIRWGIEK